MMECTSLYEQHLEYRIANSRVRNGQLLKGRFIATRGNCLEGTVITSICEVLVQGRHNLNRAIDGDMVAVEVLNQEDWAVPLDQVIDSDNEEDYVEPTVFDERNKQITGKVVIIFSRKKQNFDGFVGPLSVEDRKNGRHFYCLFLPLENHIPKIVIEAAEDIATEGQLLTVAIKSWNANSKYPHGYIVKIFEKTNHKSRENNHNLTKHHIWTRFSRDVLLEAYNMNDWISYQEHKKRVDYSENLIFSVDQPDTKSREDSIHCIQLPNGNFEVGVHITDVSHFIQKGSEMDKEAAYRGAALYLYDHKIDMIPDLLSENICSFCSNKKRLAISCVWELTTKAEIVSTRFYKSIVTSKINLNFEEAQEMVDDHADYSELAQALRRLLNLSKILRDHRISNGAHIYSCPQIKFELDGNDTPLAVTHEPEFDTNSMISEFMILTNMSVAKKIYTQFPDSALLRRQPRPFINNFRKFVQAGLQQGFKIDLNFKSFAEQLEMATENERKFLIMQLYRCFRKGEYFVSGNYPPSEFYEYGMALPIYTHFTSPCRRYSDIVVHRLLSACIKSDESQLMNRKQLEELCDALNNKNTILKDATKDSFKLHMHMFIKQNGIADQAFIMNILENEMKILIVKYEIEITIPLVGLASYYNKEEKTIIVGGRLLHTYDSVYVRLTSDRRKPWPDRMLYLRLDNPYIPGRFVIFSDFKPICDNEDTQDAELPTHVLKALDTLKLL